MLNSKIRRTTKPSQLRHDVNRTVASCYADPILIAKLDRIRRHFKKQNQK